uniref:Putative blue-light photoreceptor PCMADA3 n=1 Tax=Pilobolus crystallinus TaxID=369761 RepID=B8YIE5_9FUNG|nr:putative blue-light photoreceptor PCMADA3 [Pilobolus crystallinus]
MNHTQFTDDTMFGYSKIQSMNYQSDPHLISSELCSLLPSSPPLQMKRLAPPPVDTSLACVYSNTGFDMIQVLSRLMNRPNPQIQLGPIDLSCAFVVSDAKQYDMPIIYCSPAFERLTGYTNKEIVGKNCRFLQSPDGKVTCGSRRQHTDNQAVYHIKGQINQGKEHQASIINYRKDGQPFVNLVTVIPLWDENNTIELFVGLQVDLVEQPNSIIEKMKDGTYIMNYHQSSSMLAYQAPMDSRDEYFRELPSDTNASQYSDVMSLIDATQIDFENLATRNQQVQKEWNKTLLDQCTDFIHVLSLKGLFLYVSNSSESMLEYSPHELIGDSLSSICHPSDIIPVMREIKEASNDPDKIVTLLFRIRRKYSGYFWFECRGKLHMDQNKGRKCLILSGRERPVYRLLENQVKLSNMNENNESSDEFWAKLSPNGLFLYVTPQCKDTVGFAAESLEHESIYQYVENGAVTDITRALELVRSGDTVKVYHTILNSKGSYVPVISIFYPGDIIHGQGQPSFILLQMKSHQGEIDDYDTIVVCTIENSLEHTNVFSELDPIRTTNWQYELYQLQKTNKKLKDQLDSYTNPKTRLRKKKKIKTCESSKICANCQRKDSPEWRKGPNGPKELCNACGLRYAKSLGSKK